MQAAGDANPDRYVINVSLDQLNHRSLTMEYQKLVPANSVLVADPDIVVSRLLTALGDYRATQKMTTVQRDSIEQAGSTIEFSMHTLAKVLRSIIDPADVCLCRVPIAWQPSWWTFEHPLSFLGYDGGGGIGSGPGMAVGSALALKQRNSSLFPVAILGDGDFLMGATAIWTAVHYEIPLMVIVANNRSFFNDELHQVHIARRRNRPEDNAWIGQAITQPDIDVAAMARSQGAEGYGPLLDEASLEAAIDQGTEDVRRGKCAVLDVHVERGYPPTLGGAIVGR